MKTRASNLPNMVLTLLVITVVAGLCLGYINSLTAGPKAAVKLERKTAAIQNVLPDFDNDPVEDMRLHPSATLTDSLEYYPGYLEERLSGAGIEGWSKKGYNGLVKVLVGFNSDGSINNIAVLEQNETPGLGTKIKNEAFIAQFRGKDPTTFKLKVKKDQGDVDALTGATISSRAFIEAVQMAYDAFVESQKN